MAVDGEDIRPRDDVDKDSSRSERNSNNISVVSIPGIVLLYDTSTQLHEQWPDQSSRIRIVKIS